VHSAPPSVFITSSIDAFDTASELKRFLDLQGVSVILWQGGIGQSASLLGNLITQLANIEFAVILLDSRYQQRREAEQGRENAIFELGLAIGALGSDRVLILILGESRILPIDIAHFRYIQLQDPPPQSAIQRTAEQIQTALRALEPRREAEPSYYSCFLSYSADDSNFVRRLVDDLANMGVPCWLDEREMRGGARIAEEIQQGLGQQDKMILVLSRSSTRSSWVEKELNLALRLERERGQEIVFPLRLDGSVLESNAPWLERLVAERHIESFEDWQDEASYHKSLRRLVRDLTISAATGSGRNT
jgi:TIR domain/Predicted nucleotide-binding protein containing TIR-like domain